MAQVHPKRSPPPFEGGPRGRLTNVIGCTLCISVPRCALDHGLARRGCFRFLNKKAAASECPYPFFLRHQVSAVAPVACGAGPTAQATSMRGFNPL
jgi:hypothetical protein